MASIAIFFLSAELRSDPHQLLRLLTKLFENFTPTETTVAVRIAARFKADAYEDGKAKAIAVSGLEKVKRADRSVTTSSAECLAQNLQWR